MSKKSSFVICLILLFSLVACSPKTAVSTMPEPDTVATGVAATLEAASTATQRALATNQAPLSTPTIEVITPEPTISPATPTEPASPTPESTEIPAVRIAYIKDGDVHLWTEGYGSIGLSDTYDAVALSISSDGELIAFKRQGLTNYFPQELWAVNTHGTPNPRVLVSAADISAYGPTEPNPNISGVGVSNFSWRPNTHELAYNTMLIHIGVGFAGSNDLRLVNADSMAKTTLFEKGQAGTFYYSPDGTQIALSYPEKISLVNATGSDLRPDVITFPHVITYSEYSYHPHPIWAANSSSLRVAIPPEDGSADPPQATGLWSIPVDGSPAVLLGNIQAMSFDWPNNAFAPNLEHVIYVMIIGEPSANQRELHIADPDGSHDVVYDRGESLVYMTWALDSQHFTYHITRGENKGVYVGMLDEPTQLISSDPSMITEIQWIDDTRYAYLQKNGGHSELHISNLNGDALAFIDTIPDESPEFVVFP